ncbi:MAG: hypothetical protein U0165_09505 [Polyangiaceae bacterium]
MNRTHFRFAAWPLLAMGLLAPTMMNCSAADDLKDLNCDEFKAGFTASADFTSKVGAEVSAVVQATGDLQALAESMRVDVGLACRKIAKAGGQDGNLTWDGSGTPTDDQVKEACDAATVAINGVLNATGEAAVTVSVTITGGRCEADISASGECTASCSGDASCSGGDISAECSAEVLCEGTCSAEGACVGSPEVKVSCEGSCDGSCDGTVTGGCEGTCEGTCDGQASNGQAAGSCTGTCEGTCTKPSASASCSGKCSAKCSATPPNVKCEGKIVCNGTCTGKATCSGKVTPPSCSASAECQSSCQASVQAKANCTPPQVTYVVEGSGAANAQAFFDVLTTEIPTLLLVAETKGKIAADIIATAGGNISGALQSAVNAGGKAAVCAGVAITAFAEASVSVSASVKVSASASASASGGT